MNNRMRTILVLGAGLAAGAAARAQSSIDATQKYCWSENAGWLNWADANGGASGVRDNGTFFSGWAWSENLGWISMGDGTPAVGPYYGNVDGSDCGVNIAADGTLMGLAWSENAGWINFSGGAMASPAQSAKIDSTNRLRGYAWGENIGWINLDDANSYIQLTCYANCDRSTAPPILNANDFQCFLNKFASGDPSANCDRSTAAPILNANDFQCFLNKFSAGCT